MKRPTIKGIICTLVGTASLALVITAGSAPQAHAMTTKPLVPAVQVQDDEGGSSLCFNRSGNGTSAGTNVISYNCGYANNDFEFVQFTGMCNAGKVSSTCPFTVGSGLNNAYLGATIGGVEAYDENLCVGSASATTFSAKLETCPNIDGVGGGYSTIDVFGYSRSAGGVDFYALVNRNWSDTLYTAVGTSGCGGNNFGCSQVASATNGYQTPIVFNQGDTSVQQGLLSSALYYDIWGEQFN